MLSILHILIIVGNFEPAVHFQRHYYVQDVRGHQRYYAVHLGDPEKLHKIHRRPIYPWVITGGKYKHKQHCWRRRIGVASRRTKRRWIYSIGMKLLQDINWDGYFPKLVWTWHLIICNQFLQEHSSIYPQLVDRSQKTESVENKNYDQSSTQRSCNWLWWWLLWKRANTCNKL